MSVVFLILLIVTSSILIILIFMQSGQVKNLGGSLVGSGDIELFEKTKKRGSEKALHLITAVFVALFFIFSFLLLLL